ncbi:hypothetical protein [Streptomyces sp. NPDC057877]|uniref:hypothetical protein n=1 Tax=Streptomyces sp. NPDC057877 TaxID=3346269 RepID=UPI0036ABE5C7
MGSLHIYEEHLGQAEDLTSVTASAVMPDLTTPWRGFDDLLGQVAARDATGHPGWNMMSETLRSYRLWKDGARDQAWQVADKIDGPLGEALIAWYGELNNRARTCPTRETARTR